MFPILPLCYSLRFTCPYLTTPNSSLDYPDGGDYPTNGMGGDDPTNGSSYDQLPDSYFSDDPSEGSGGLMASINWIELMKIINHQMGLTEHYDRLMCTLSTDPQAGIVDVLDKLRTHFDVPTDFLRVRSEI